MDTLNIIYELILINISLSTIILLYNINIAWFYYYKQKNSILKRYNVTTSFGIVILLSYLPLLNVITYIVLIVLFVLNEENHNKVVKYLFEE